MQNLKMDNDTIPYKKEFLYLSSEELPKKVAAICHSVIKLYNEGISYYKMTVSDIAKDADIGKGTVYEYFTNKEEIIVTAMLLELKNGINSICEGALAYSSFDEKYDVVIEWLWEHIPSNQVLRQMLLNRYSEHADAVSCQITAQLINQTRAREMLDSILDAGVAEGLFAKPQNVLQENAAFGVFAYCIVAMMRPEEFGNCTHDQIKEYCKGLFIKILS